MTIPAYPLQWPTGWKRTPPVAREEGRFGRRSRDAGQSWARKKDLSIADAVQRVRDELSRMRVRDDDLVVSTNVALRLDGWPRSDQAAPSDPGAAVYWRERDGATRCMAIDRYRRVADNLAAIAATLDAMRAIERHGGAAILDRAFQGFQALPHQASDAWHDVLGVAAHTPTDDVRAAFARARSAAHPDKGGTPEQFQRVTSAWMQFCAERGIDP